MAFRVHFGKLLYQWPNRQ